MQTIAHLYRFRMFEPIRGQFHIGLLDFNIIASDTILLIISISTTFALSVTIRVSNEAKFFQEVKFLGFMHCLLVKIEKSSKMSKILPKTCKKHLFKIF